MSDTSNFGRPPKFTDPEEFQVLVDAYFEDCKVQDKVPTVNGLTLAVGFSSRQSLFDYAAKPDFMDTVKSAKTRLENEWEQRLAGANATGTIFWLKNQGWSDRNEQVISNPDGSGLFTGIKVTLVSRPSD